ncbi:hypothetical protein DV735_g5120, partial [Chaetothyriales sp. CBS 134920]
MAQKAAKSLAARNTARLKQTHLISLLLHSFFLAVAFTLRRGSASLKTYAVLATPALVIEFYLDRLARPVYNADGSLLRAGDDLGAAGVTEFLWDVVYWTWITVVAAAVFGNRAWWLYVAVPAYAGYVVFTTATGLKGMLGGIGGAADEGQAQSKRQKKMEARGGSAQKIRYQR